MKATRNHSHSSLFLMELILAILFFSIASGVCVQLFARAHTVSAGSTDLNRAILCAQSAADIVRTSEDPVALLGAKKLDDGYAVYYDRDWQPMFPLLDSAPPPHVMQITFSDSDAGLTQAQIIVSTYRAGGEKGYRKENLKEIYRLSTAHYDPTAGATEVNG